MREQGVSTNIIWRLFGINDVTGMLTTMQRVKLKIVLPTTATAKFAIDIAILESIFTLEINREIFIPNREVGRFSLLRKRIGRSLAKSGGLEALDVFWQCINAPHVRNHNTTL